MERDRRHFWHLANWDSPLPSGATGCCLDSCRWIWDSGVEVQSAPDLMEDLHRLLESAALYPRLLELKT